MILDEALSTRIQASEKLFCKRLLLGNELSVFVCFRLLY